jgi:hypothetical protein
MLVPCCLLLLGVVFTAILDRANYKNGPLLNSNYENGPLFTTL